MISVKCAIKKASSYVVIVVLVFIILNASILKRFLKANGIVLIVWLS